MKIERAWDYKLARLVARPLATWRVDPNAVTTVGLLIGLFSGYLFALGNPAAANWGAAVFMLAVFNDHLDGEVARARNKTSAFGHYYDHAAALASYMAMFIGAGIGLRGGFLEGWAPILGVLAGVSVAAIMSVRMRIEAVQGKTAVRQNNFLGFEPEDTLYLVGPITWLGGMPHFLVAAGIGAPVFLFWVLWQSRAREGLTAGNGPRS